MSFVTISNTVPVAQSFNQAGTGKYVSSTTVFGGVQNYYLLSSARKIKPVAGASHAYTFGVTRYAELDVVIAGVTKRLGCRVRVVVEIDDGFDLSSTDGMLRQTDEFISSANMTRLLNGEV